MALLIGKQAGQFRGRILVLSKSLVIIGKYE